MICYQIIRNLKYIIDKLSFLFVKNEYSNLNNELNENDNIVDIYYIAFNPIKYLFYPNNDQEEIDKKAEKLKNSFPLERSISISSEIMSEINEEHILNNLDIMKLSETMKLNDRLFFHSLNDNNGINVNNNRYNNYMQNKIINNIIFNNNNNSKFNNNIIIDNKQNNSANYNIFNNDNINLNIANNNNILNSLNNADSGFFLFKNENSSNSQQNEKKPIYFGQLKDGKYHRDKCKLQYPNGDIYEGSFREGFRHGQGKLTNKNNSYCYDGLWEYDKKNGK